MSALHVLINFVNFPLCYCLYFKWTF